jgi:hypothetical protein
MATTCAGSRCHDRLHRGRAYDRELLPDETLRKDKKKMKCPVCENENCVDENCARDLSGKAEDFLGNDPKWPNLEIALEYARIELEKCLSISGNDFVRQRLMVRSWSELSAERLFEMLLSHTFSRVGGPSS